MVIEAMSLEMTEESRDVSDTAKRITLKETAWQKISTCTMKRKLMKILI